MVKKWLEITYIIIISLFVIVLAYFLLRESRLFGIGVLGIAFISIILAGVSGVKLTSIVPDLTFGAVDTGLLTLGVVIGAGRFGIVGALVGGVVIDAITDGIAGYFEGGISEWLRSKGINERRTALGSFFGKMSGCLLGAGISLTFFQIIGISVLK